MKYELDFVTVTQIDHNIAEVIVKQNTELTLEMVEEYDALLSSLFTGDFGLIINRVNSYTYTFEAKLSIASVKGLKAIAVINYSAESEEVTKKLIEVRHFDNLNIKQFSGLEMGRKEGLVWLKQELCLSVSNKNI